MRLGEAASSCFGLPTPKSLAHPSHHADRSQACRGPERRHILGTMDLGQSTLGHLSTLVGDKQAYVRAAVVADGVAWRLRTSEIVLGTEPPRWMTAQWLYP